MGCWCCCCCCWAPSRTAEAFRGKTTRTGAVALAALAAGKMGPFLPPLAVLFTARLCCCCRSIWAPVALYCWRKGCCPPLRALFSSGEKERPLLVPSSYSPRAAASASASASASSSASTARSKASSSSISSSPSAISSLSSWSSSSIIANPSCCCPSSSSGCW